jgi:hypothetical protein
MDTVLPPKQTDPREVLIERADKELAHAYEQISRADEEIARAEERLSKLEHDAARTAVRRKRPAVRGFTGLILAACIFAAAFVWQSSYGNTARQIVARWAPQFVATSSPLLGNPGLPPQPGLPTARAVAAKTAAPQPALLAQAVAEDVTSTTAAPSPELTPLLQSMARDLATVGQGIEQLKARQEQLARDNVSAVEQLKAGQEQMARAIAKASEAKASEARPSDARASADAKAAADAKASAQNLRPRTSAPPLPPAATTRKPAPTHSAAPHARTQPEAATQLR